MASWYSIIDHNMGAAWGGEGISSEPVCGPAEWLGISQERITPGWANTPGPGVRQSLPSGKTQVSGDRERESKYFTEKIIDEKFNDLYFFGGFKPLKAKFM